MLRGSRPFSVLGLILVSLAVGVGLTGRPAVVQAAEALIMPLAEESLLLDGELIGDRLIAVGERGHILLSEDSGRSWQQQPVPTRVLLTSVSFVDQQTGWAAGHDAVILGTRDGGLTWQQLYSDPEDQRPILDLWFKNAREGFAVGAYGLFLVTRDGGRNWSELDFDPATIAPGHLDAETVYNQSLDEQTWGIDYHLNHLAATGGGRLYLAAEAGRVYRSDDNCRSWLQLPSPYEGSFFGSLPLDQNSLLLFGLRGHLFRSDDAGITWRQLETGTQATLNDAIRLRDGRIVVAGLAGTLLVSTDGGETFSLYPLADRAGIARVLEAPDGALVLLGEQGSRRVSLREPAGGDAP